MHRLLLLLVLLLAPACAPVTVVESPWKAAPEWAADQHRRMAERLRSWIDAARPVSSYRAISDRFTFPGTVIVGESHDTPRYSKLLVRELLAREPEAAVWEEGIIWRTSDPPRLQGLYSRQWRGSESADRRVLAGGDQFNEKFAKLVQAGLPPSLIVYAGNAHAIHTPDFDGAEPRSGGPLPADAIAATGARVAAIAVYPRANLLSYADLNMTIAILAALSNGKFDAARALEEAAWSEAFLDSARSDLARRGDFLVEVAPGRFIVSLGEGSSPWSLKTVTALRLFLSDPKVQSFFASGSTVELKQRAVNNGIIGPAYEEFLFEVLPPGLPARTIRVTPRGVLPRRRRPSQSRNSFDSCVRPPAAL